MFFKLLFFFHCYLQNILFKKTFYVRRCFSLCIFNNPSCISNCQSRTSTIQQRFKYVIHILFILSDSQFLKFFIQKLLIFRPMVICCVICEMQHEPEFNALITPRRMILKLRILLIQHFCPLSHPINITGWKAVFVINTPYLAIHRPPIYNFSEVRICTVFSLQILLIKLSIFTYRFPLLIFKLYKRI